MFTVLDDEFGYWGNAAYFYGLDWSSVVSIIPYYSYGYSLLLIPLFWIIDSPVLMYKAAIILNGILLTSSFILCFDISRKLASEIDKNILLCISFLIFLYPAYTVYSNIAWSECLLIFSCWLLTWCFVGLNKDSSVFKFILIGLLSGYIYMIHQRTIGILIASIGVILLMKISNRINFKHLFSVVLPLVILITLHLFIKSNIQSNLWLNSLGNLTNDFSGQMSKVKLIFSLEGIIKGLKVFTGQFFYLGISSFLVFYFGLYELFSGTSKRIAISIKNRSLDLLNKDDNFYIYAFLLIATILTMAISVIFMINLIRTDQIVYGRYTEILVGPIILIGFIRYLRMNETSLRGYFPKIIGFGFISIVTGFVINSYDLDAFFPQNCVGLVFMTTPLSVYVPTLICILGFLLLRRMLFNHRQMIITALCLSIIFTSMSEMVMQSIMLPENISADMIRLADSIRENEDELPVYFLWNNQVSNVDDKWNSRNGSSRYYAEYYQLLLKDIKISLVDENDLRTSVGNIFVIIVGADYQAELIGDYEYCMSAGNSHLFYGGSK